MQLGLAGDEGVHLVGVLEHVGVCKGGVDRVKLGQQIHHRLHALAHYLDHRLARVELGLLLQVSHRVSRGKYHLALVILVDTGDNLEQRGFTRAVQTDDAYLGAVEK